MDLPAIRTERLELVVMPLPFMRALQAHDVDMASREIGADVPPEMPDDLVHFLAHRIPDLTADPTIQPWLGRAIVWTHPDGRREVTGTIGFHGPPDAASRVEIGYRVVPGWRRRGIATEAMRALLRWAETDQGIHRFRASVAPGNTASLAIITGFGFRPVGTRMDEIDGLELVFELDRDSETP
jgi:RimJ/RimL family protein N-acetyltransferase